MRVPVGSATVATSDAAASPAASAPTLSGPTWPATIAERPGVLVAQADLRSDEIQELNDQMGELTKAATAAGVVLRFHLLVEAGGKLSPDAVARLNTLLAQVSPHLMLTRDGRW